MRRRGSGRGQSKEPCGDWAYARGSRPAVVGSVGTADARRSPIPARGEGPAVQGAPAARRRQREEHSAGSSPRGRLLGAHAPLGRLPGDGRVGRFHGPDSRKAGLRCRACFPADGPPEPGGTTAGTSRQGQKLACACLAFCPAISFMGTRLEPQGWRGAQRGP